MLNAQSSLESWLNQLEQGQSGGIIDMGLARMQDAKARLALHPQCPIIIVGGTNGKGSVCAFLTAIYREAGFRVGTLTSPHLLRFNERIAIDGKPVSDQEIVASFAHIQAACGDLSLTYFEYNTLTAVDIFLRQQVDIMVLEVGLGGRLDAVNVFDADVSIIASLAIDHVHFLGNHLEDIAYEKAGIFRTDKPALIGQTPPARMLAHAQEIDCPLWVLGHDFSTQVSENRQWSFAFAPHNHALPSKKRHALPMPVLRGAYQIHNAALALAAIECLFDRLPVNIGAIKQGLLLAENPGRFQVLPGRPVVVWDVAHNPHAAQALRQNLIQLPFAQHKMAVFSMLADKDMSAVVNILKDEFDQWLIAPLAVPRAADIETLHSVLRQCGIPDGKIHLFPNIQAAWKSALSQAQENDRIAVFGSFHTVAAIAEKHHNPQN